MITDLKNIILDYTISEMDGLSPSRIKKSFQQMSKELDVYMPGQLSQSGKPLQPERLGRIEKFTIMSVKHGDDGDLRIVTSSPIKKTHRIPLNLTTTKQVYTTLLHMHGLTGRINVSKLEFANKTPNKYTETYITDIETINRDEFELPAEQYGAKAKYPRNTMIKMRATLFKQSKIDRIKAKVSEALMQF